jgi:hypothetical protein
MNRLVTLDPNDRIVADGKVQLSREQMEAGYWFFNMGRYHPDYAAKINERIIP